MAFYLLLEFYDVDRSLVFLAYDLTHEFNWERARADSGLHPLCFK